MTDAERAEFQRQTSAFLDEWRADPAPNRRDFDALRRKYDGKANIEALLRYGSGRGWI